MDWKSLVAESNRIEGILRPPTDAEVNATQDFVIGPRPTVETVSELAVIFAGARAKLRDRKGMDVRVGDYRPPVGGPEIRERLERLLLTIDDSEPWLTHIEYESLHPFIDGNGRTGRALWAWQMWRWSRETLELNFLHAFYYQTLRYSR